MTIAGWGWKLATDPDDVINFLNGCGPYERPVKDAHVTAVWDGSRVTFHAFYQTGAAGQPPGSWGWKKATDPDDALSFLNGTGAYCQPVKEAKLASVRQGDQPEFYIFYTMELVPARVIDCRVLEATGGAPGFARLRLGWRYCDPGERPQRLLVTVYHEEQHWKNIMPDGQACTVAHPERATQADVMVLRLYKGPHKIVLRASYADHADLEYAFERLL